jgi:hypothetical protein
VEQVERARRVAGNWHWRVLSACPATWRALLRGHARGTAEALRSITGIPTLLARSGYEDSLISHVLEDAFGLRNVSCRNLIRNHSSGDPDP